MYGDNRNANPEQLEELANRLEGPDGQSGVAANLNELFNRAATLDASEKLSSLRPLQTWASETAIDLRSRATGISDDDVLAVTAGADTGAGSIFDALPGFDAFGFGSDHTPQEDAQRAANLLNKGDELTDAELTILNGIIFNNMGNNEFAGEFATQVGPDALLQLWSGLIDPENYSEADAEREELLTEMQGNLGVLLGTITRSDDPAMADWEQELIGLGGERVEGATMWEPYGFQVMSNLMQTGGYDADFLNNYGNALVSWEQTEPPAGFGWASTAAGDYDPVIGDAYREDPMTGFMDAISVNPDAATQFFLDEENSEYLLNLRPAEGFSADTDEDGNNLALEATGAAFFAATTGISASNPRSGYVEHEPEHTQVLDQALASLSAMGDDFPPEFRYPVSMTLLNHGEEFYQTAGSLASAAQPLDKTELFAVTTQISRDPDAYALLNEGMNAVLVDSFSDTEEFDGAPIDPGDTLHRAGLTVGFLEEARYEALYADYSSEADRAAWMNRFRRYSMGGAVSLIPKLGAGVSGAVILWSGAWFDGEIEALNEGYTEDSTEIARVRNGQLEMLADEWHNAHSDWADNETEYDTRAGYLGQINDSANTGTERTEGSGSENGE